jgi:hypothetical protein
VAVNRHEADAALERLGAESERIADALLAMDNHPGHQLLRASSLSGLTLRRWTEASAAMEALWEQFAAYRRLLADARQVRARRDRPGNAELAELNGLLTGPAVVLGERQIPIEKRSLTGPAVVVDHLSLHQLIARMKAAYSRITDVLGAAHDAWSQHVQVLDPLDSQVRSITALTESLGYAPAALERARAELITIRQQAVADPLGTPISARARRLVEELAVLRAELAGLADVRDGFEHRVRQLEEQLALLRHTVTRSARARQEVLVKIASPVLPDVVDTVSLLLPRLDALQARYRSRQWRLLAREMNELERAVNRAVADAQTVLTTIIGLLDRRSELRGRLDAYCAKAARLGHAEDAELGALHREAHELLFTTPCDLRASTVAVARYQHAVVNRSEETRR